MPIPEGYTLWQTKNGGFYMDNVPPMTVMGGTGPVVVTLRVSREDWVTLTQARGEVTDVQHYLQGLVTTHVDALRKSVEHNRKVTNHGNAH